MRFDKNFKMCLARFGFGITTLGANHENSLKNDDWRTGGALRVPVYPEHWRQEVSGV